MKVLVVTDNIQLYTAFKEILKDAKYDCYNVEFACSNESPLRGLTDVHHISIKEKLDVLISTYQLIISLHCKQLFPEKLVKCVRCINVHPGFNPYNRGWFPQVFSILNGKPLGATIHVIDELLDHGPIIVQEKVPVFAWDTSISAYNRVIKKEIELLKEWLPDILSGNYQASHCSESGNINLKKDYNALCELDMSASTTMKDCLDKLRALTHGDYKNAYFIDKVTGKKVFVALELKVEE